MRLVSLLAVTVALIPATALAQTEPAPAPAPTAEDDDHHDHADEIVVTGVRRGSVIGDIPPENQLDARDVRATGATDITELLDALAPQIGSARGRGGEAPVLLVNGRRISGFRELRDIPPEAIERVDILPEEVALKYGYRADQRVVNFVLRRRFTSTVARADGDHFVLKGHKALITNAPEADLFLIYARVDGRIVPGQTLEQYLAEVQRVVGPDVRINVLDHHDGTVFDAATPLYDTITRVLARRDPGGVAVPYMIPGFTDSFAYARLGATCYGFSPVRLGPELNFTRMYHGHDERIPVDGFRWGVRTLWEVVSEFVG